MRPSAVAGLGAAFYINYQSMWLGRQARAARMQQGGCGAKPGAGGTVRPLAWTCHTPSLGHGPAHKVAHHFPYTSVLPKPPQWLYGPKKKLGVGWGGVATNVFGV